MGEIDDLYKQEAEDIDLNFLEGLKDSKNHEKDIEKYRNDLRKSREVFVKKYGKFNASESKRISKMKKKIEGMGEFKHLEISHFDFGFGFWERLNMRRDVLWFNFMRRIRRFNSWIFPRSLIYGWCKVRNFVRGLWRDFVGIVYLCWEGLKKFSVGSGIWIWGEIRSGFKIVVGLMKKTLFWRKEKKEEKKEEGEKALEEKD